MTTEILICTCASGIRKIANVINTTRPDVRYLVSFQYHSEQELNIIPAELKIRDDVRLVTIKSGGLSANRNNAINASQGDILVFADDDNYYDTRFFERISQTFSENEEIDIACFRSADYEGRLCRAFPENAFDFRYIPRGYFVRTCEIVARRSSIIGKVRFDEHFGLGADYLACGEEEIFLNDAVKCGLKIKYFPLIIVQTDSNTTGTHFSTNAAVRRSKGAVLAAIHGECAATLRIIKYALFNVRGMSRVKAFKNMLEGVRYSKKIGRC